MESTKTKRGRPPKARDRVKAKYLDIRLGASEKATFKDAAVLAGLDLSAWVRERLRMASRRELESAGLPVAFLAGSTKSRMTPGRLEQLVEADFRPPSTIHLKFADGTYLLPIERLEMPLDRIRWKTAKASPNGTAMTVTAAKGEVIRIDSGTLRYLVDERYAAGIDAALDSLRLSRDELEDLARDPLPQKLRASKDLRRESWK